MTTNPEHYSIPDLTSSLSFFLPSPLIGWGSILGSLIVLVACEVTENSVLEALWAVLPFLFELSRFSQSSFGQVLTSCFPTIGRCLLLSMFVRDR
jgi:hypothetical protein